VRISPVCPGRGSRPFPGVRHSGPTNRSRSGPMKSIEVLIRSWTVATRQRRLCLKVVERGREGVPRTTLIPTVVNFNAARRRGGRVAEGGGLLNLPRSYRFNRSNNLQMGQVFSSGASRPHLGTFAPHFALQVLGPIRAAERLGSCQCLLFGSP
jgi:hypothetical protein